jgi:hypothetical protein
VAAVQVGPRLALAPRLVDQLRTVGRQHRHRGLPEAAAVKAHQIGAGQPAQPPPRIGHVDAEPQTDQLSGHEPKRPIHSSHCRSRSASTRAHRRRATPCSIPVVLLVSSCLALAIRSRLPFPSMSLSLPSSLLLLLLLFFFFFFFLSSLSLFDLLLCPWTPQTLIACSRPLHPLAL